MAGGLTQLIEALTILKKYGDPDRPTHCEHDTLYICDIDPAAVSNEDRQRLMALGIFDSGDPTSEVPERCFMSFRFGSA